MVEDDALARQAADPGTPLATLQDLAAHHPRLRPAIAANPSTYPDLLDWLGRLADPDVDAALAARGGPSTTAEYPAVPAHPPAQEKPAEDGPRVQEEPYTEVLPAPTAPAAPPPVIPPATVAPRPGSTAPRRTSVMGRTPGPGHPPAGAPTGAAPAAGSSTAPSVAAPTGATPSGAASLGVGSDPDRGGGARRTWALVALAVVLALALIWTLTQRSPEPGPTSAPTAGATSEPTDTAAPSTTEPTTAAPDDSAEEVRAAREALSGLPAASSCADPGADAGVFDAFAAAAAPEGAWADPADGDIVLAALTGLQDACGAPHAVTVSDALADGSPAIVATLAAAPDWVTVARPAPPGAQQRASFVSPSGNIACSLGEGSATCTINDRTFADPATCGPGPVTLVVGLGGDARSDCAATPAAGNGTLEYGQSATSGRFACTSEESGVTCWSTLSGRGFTVARAAIQTF